MASLTMARPAVSSPLAGASQPSLSNPQRLAPKRTTPAFPSSRALRPFPTISHLIQPAKPNAPASTSKPIKLIEPPQNFKTTFLLDLTQAEFSRQD